MSTPGSKTQMEPQEVHKEVEIVTFGKPRWSPDKSLGSMYNCSLQQRNKVTIKTETHGTPVGPLPQTLRRKGPELKQRKVVDYTSCWIPSDPLPKNQGLIESQLPLLLTLAA